MASVGGGDSDCPLLLKATKSRDRGPLEKGIWISTSRSSIAGRSVASSPASALLALVVCAAVTASATLTDDSALLISALRTFIAILVRKAAFPGITLCSVFAAPLCVSQAA